MKKKLLIMSIAIMAIVASILTVSAFAANTVTIADGGISISEYTDASTGEVDDAYVNVNVTYTATADATAEEMSRITFMLSATTVADELEGNESKIVYIDEQVTPTSGTYSFVIEKARIQSALELDSIDKIEGQTLLFKMGGVGVDEAEAVNVVYNSPKSAADIVYGDINYSDTINSADALLALQYAVSATTLTTEQITIADVNGSSTVNSADALLILQHAVGIIEKFPVEE